MNRGGLIRLLLLIGLAVLPSFSCRALMEYKPPASVSNRNSDLLKSQVGPDTVTFDILIVHIPHQERQLLEQLWQEVDEQVLDPDLKNRLHGNGFRAGIIGASIPEPLSRLMEIKGRGLRTSLEEEVRVEEQGHASPMTLSKIQTLQPGMITVIPTLDKPVDRIPVLSCSDGTFSAELYHEASTSFSVAAEPLSDGSVSFELTPFLTFGNAEPVTKYQYGQLVRTTEQPTKTFDELRGNFPLRPGQFLVIGPSDQSVAGLGQYFFTQGIGDFDRKIIVIRLLFTQHDKLFHQFPGFQEVYENGKDGNRAGVQESSRKETWEGESETEESKTEEKEK